MPPVAIAAGIGAVGSIAGSAISSSAAKKAAATEAQTAQNQIAAAQQNQQYVAGLSQPTIDRGNAAGTVQANLLGLGTDPNSAAQGLATFRGSTGYQDLLNTGLGAVNSNAYARGLGASGATLKALQAKGQSIADQSAQTYLGNLNALSTQGQNAVAGVSNSATGTTNAIAGFNQNAADASSNASLLQGASWNKALQNLANIGSSFSGGGATGLASSYGAASLSGQPTQTGPVWGQAGHENYDPLKVNSDPFLRRYGLGRGF